MKTHENHLGGSRGSNPTNIYGVETEYTVTVEGVDGVSNELVGSCHSLDAELGLYVEPANNPMASVDTDAFEDAVGSQGLIRNGNYMLSNGARLYEDPSGPEYCTAEQLSAQDATIAVYDGDRLTYEIFNNLVNNDRIRSFQINRRVVDHNRSSRGVHLNHSTSLGELSDSEMEVLATAQVVKGALFGSGGLLMDESGATHFHHSPRLSITKSLSSNYWKDRPLIRYPFKGDNGDTHRVETLPTDGVSFPWSLRANLIFTNAVIRLIEAGFTSDMPRLESPVATAKHVGHYGHEAKVRVQDDSGEGVKIMRPQDVVVGLAELALIEGVNRGFSDDESTQVLSEIIDTVDLVNSGNLDHARFRVESIFRKMHMARKMVDRGVNLGSDIMCRVDYEWDKIGGGRAETLRDRTKGHELFWYGFSKVPETFRYKKRIVKPPQGTRAEQRAQRIIESKGLDNSTWTTIDYGADTVHPEPKS